MASPTESVLKHLRENGGPLCAACLALQVHVSLDEANHALQLLAPDGALVVAPGTCGSCGREGLAVARVPARRS